MSKRLSILETKSLNKIFLKIWNNNVVFKYFRSQSTVFGALLNTGQHFSVGNRGQAKLEPRDWSTLIIGFPGLKSWERTLLLSSRFSILTIPLGNALLKRLQILLYRSKCLKNPSLCCLNCSTNAPPYFPQTMVSVLMCLSHGCNAGASN